MESKPLFWDVLDSRRSIRKFTEDAVPADLVKQILAAGVQAPNARNRQSWRFVVLSTPKTISMLAEALNQNFKRDKLAAGKPAAEVDQHVADRKARICAAPVIILLFVDTADLDNFSADEPANPEYLMAVQSAALAGGQMLLAAQALGLGGVWMGGPLYAQQPICDALDQSQTWLAQGMLLIGYPAEAPHKKDRKSSDSVVKYI
jgi:coenzyme F420-0:L-glutamate ligase/coenzyme F420-1:gamma-L-glutamate ligase